MSAWRDLRGYSLAELLVATAVLGLVMAGTLSILRSGLGAYRWGAARVEAQQSARVALERMAKELREAGYDPTAAGIDAVVVAEPTRIVVQRDLDGDGAIDPTRERIAFVLRAGETVLRRDAGGGAQPIVNGVKRLVLTYYDAAGQVTTDAAAVRSIDMRIEVGITGPAVAMQTQATIRNRRL